MQVMPNLMLAPNKEHKYITIGYDPGGKYYILNQYSEIIKDGVWLAADKRIVITLEQLEDLIEKAKTFIGIHKKYDKK